MKKHKTTIIKTTKIIGDKKFLVDTIYNNFNNLSTIPILMHTKNDIYNLLSSPYFIGLFIFVNEKLKGYLVGEEKMLNDQRYVFYISYFYITKELRNSGLGTILMKQIENIIKINKNIKYIVLTCDTTNNKLVNFYIKRGYNIDILLQTHSKHNVFSKII